MRLALLCVLSASVAFAAGPAAAASSTCDATTLSDARAAAARTCDCGTATSHKDYVKCVVGTVRTAMKAKTLTRECAAAVRKCAVKSTCGATGAVSCCETTAKGTTKCSVKRDATACKAPHGGTARVGTRPSCCDACSASGCAH